MNPGDGLPNFKIQIPLSEANSYSPSQKMPCFLWSLKVHNTVQKSMPLDPILMPMYPINTSLFTIKFYITLPPMGMLHLYISETDYFEADGAHENRNCLYVMQMFFKGIKRWLRRNHRLICSAAQNKTVNLRERQAVLLPTYRDGGRFVNNHNVLVHVNYGDRVGGNGDFMPETNQQCRVDTITHSTGGRGMKLILYFKSTMSSWHCYCPTILWWPAQWVMSWKSVSGHTKAKLHICWQTLNINMRFVFDIHRTVHHDIFL